MKASTEIPAVMPANDDRFTDPFFSRFTLRPSPTPLQLTSEIARTYRFPTLYSDVTCAIGIFHCDYARALSQMPDPSLRPVRMTRGRSVVVFSCYEYKNVMNVAPYNEVSMMIPVLRDSGWPRLGVPVLPLVAGGLFPSFGYYVFHMPVTSRENQLRGNRIWGLPKVTQEIDVMQGDGEGADCVTTVRESGGAPYFELRVPTTGSPTEFDVGANVYSRLDGALLSSRTTFRATFQVTQFPKLLFVKGAKTSRPYLQIGDSESAAILRGLDIEEHPFALRFARHMNAAFDLPEKVRT